MKRMLGVVLTFLLINTTMLAQPPSPSVVLWTDYINEFYATIGAQLLTVSPSGEISVVDVPTEAFYANAVVVGTLLSPDLRYLVIAQSAIDTSLPFPLIVIDMTTMDCCVYVEFDTTLEAYELGSFSPDGNFFSASFVGQDGTGQYGGIGIFDVNTGFMADSVPIEFLSERLSYGDGAAWALLGKWDALGIEFLPNCWQCGGAFSGEWAIWNPVATEPHLTVIEKTGRYFNYWFGSKPSAWGEIFVRETDLRFPSLSQDGMSAPANTVKYVYQPTSFDSTTLPIVFQDTAYQDLFFVEWVNDSRHYLVTDAINLVASLVGRDGSRVFLDWDYAQKFFLAGTQDGWLAIHHYGGIDTQIAKYTVSGGSVSSTVLNTYTGIGALHVLYAPYLGAGIAPVQPVAIGGFAAQSFPTSTPFATPIVATAIFQAPPTSTPAPVLGMTCPNFLPSRLVAGKFGQVTPGRPNNLRDAASINAARLGQIPGGGIFEVLNGPVCDPANSLAWWQVRYGGQVGWTAEGQGDTYWTEPLP